MGLTHCRIPQCLAQIVSEAGCRVAFEATGCRACGPLPSGGDKSYTARGATVSLNKLLWILLKDAKCPKGRSPQEGLDRCQNGSPALPLPAQTQTEGLRDLARCGRDNKAGLRGQLLLPRAQPASSPPPRLHRQSACARTHIHTCAPPQTSLGATPSLTGRAFQFSVFYASVVRVSGSGIGGRVW